MTVFIQRSFFVCFWVLAGFACYGRFCHKGARAQSFFYCLYLIVKKSQRLVFSVCLGFSQSRQDAKSSILPENDCLLLKTAPLAPMGGKILLWWGSPQKIGRNSGISSLIFKSQFLKFQIPILA